MWNKYNKYRFSSKITTSCILFPSILCLLWFFHEDFPTDKLIVTVEDRLYKRTPWIKRNYIEYFKKINQTNNLNYINFWVINAGLIGGSKKVIFTFLSLYKKRFDVNELIYQTQKMKYVDQAVLHAMLLDGDLQKEGFDVVYNTIEDDYASITIGCWGMHCTKYRPNNYSLGYYRSPRTGNYPFMVHQFTRYPQIGLSISQSCPIDNNTFCHN